jgi:hypothetical protein
VPRRVAEHGAVGAAHVERLAQEAHVVALGGRAFDAFEAFAARTCGGCEQRGRPPLSRTRSALGWQRARRLTRPHLEASRLAFRLLLAPL